MYNMLRCKCVYFLSLRHFLIQLPLRIKLSSQLLCIPCAVILCKFLPFSLLTYQQLMHFELYNDLNLQLIYSEFHRKWLYQLCYYFQHSFARNFLSFRLRCHRTIINQYASCRTMQPIVQHDISFSCRQLWLNINLMAISRFINANNLTMHCYNVYWSLCCC